MNHTEALHKVAKLLRLATSDNAAESASAAAKAQEIMDRFKLSSNDVDSLGAKVVSDEPIQHFDDSNSPLEADGRARWKYYLASGIARQNQCKVYGTRGHALGIIGRATDVGTVRYLYSWLNREIERLAARDCRGTDRTYWNNYRLGAVETVRNRLSDAAEKTVVAVKEEATRVSPHALVVVEQNLALIEKTERDVALYGKTKLNLRSGGASSVAINSNARAKGRQAGNEVRLGRSAGSLGGAAARLQ